jgi:cytochrome c-type biogenesis protein CcmH/NrfG
MERVIRASGHHRAIFAIGVALLLAAGGVTSALAQTKQKPRQPVPPAAEVEDDALTRLPESAKAERALVKKPNDRATRLQAARAQLNEGAETPSRVETAHKHALAVLEEAPSDVEALMIAAQASLLKNDPRSAARYYRAATLVDANNATAFLGLGDALTRMGDETGATAAFARYRALMGMPPVQAEAERK